MLHTCVEGYKSRRLRAAVSSVRNILRDNCGNAATLGLEDEIRQLKPGYTADLVVVNPASQPSAERLETCNDITEELFALMMLV